MGGVTPISWVGHLEGYRIFGWCCALLPRAAAGAPMSAVVPDPDAPAAGCAAPDEQDAVTTVDMVQNRLCSHADSFRDFNLPGCL